MELGLELRRQKNRQAQRRYRAKEKRNRADVNEYVQLLESALYEIKAIADTEGFERVAAIANNLLNHARRPDRTTGAGPWRESLVKISPAPSPFPNAPDTYPGSIHFDSSHFLPVTDFGDSTLPYWDPHTYPTFLQQDPLIAFTNDTSPHTSMYDSFIDIDISKLLA
jgi:hypothetical protein